MDALSLVCNIIQLADGAHKAFAAVKALHDNDGPDSGLATHCDSLHKLSYELKQSISARGSPDELDGADVALHNNAVAMASVAEELQIELSKFKGTEKGKEKGKEMGQEMGQKMGKKIIKKMGKKMDRIQDTFLYLWERHAIGELEKRLRQLQSDMDSQILVDMRQRMRDDHQNIRSEWDNLHEELRAFILTQLNKSDKALAAELEKQSAMARSSIIEESGQVKAALASESVAIRDTVSHGFNSMRIGGLAADVQAFVDSFRFAEMNSRRNASSIEHAEGSFEWIFYPETSYDDEQYQSASEQYESDSEQYESDSEQYESDSKVVIEAGKFLQWLKGNQELFWVSGKPGSGKSTLMNFLIRDPRTLEALQTGHSGSRTLIVDAFIWKPGVMLQKSARGVLCTLIHGILTEDSSVAEWLHGNTLQASRKRGPSDWSCRELESALIRAIGRAGRPACIFIDGLDEVDGRDTTQHTILDLVHSIRKIPGVKLCVASRPEPLFTRFLQHYPHLRLHYLTAGDIRSLAETTLRSARSLTAHETVTLVDRVTWLADGVFLWVRLVTNSLLTGIANGDDLETLKGRIDDMPNDLMEMYRGMWDRLGNDAPRYSQRAGLFFNILIWWTDLMNVNDYLGEISFSFRGSNPFILMVMATEPYLRRRVLYRDQETEWLDTDLLRDTCVRTRKQIRTTCAGLLEVEEEEDWDNARHTKTRVDFIHRTALDFLLNEGRDILDQGQITRQTLLEILLACNRVTDEPRVNPYHLPFYLYDTPRQWLYIFNTILSSDEPRSVFAECIHTLRKALDSLPGWREENRDFVELFAKQPNSKNLALAVSLSGRPEGYGKILRRRLLMATLNVEKHDCLNSAMINFVLQNFPIEAPGGVDADDPWLAIRLIEGLRRSGTFFDQMGIRVLMDRIAHSGPCAMLASREHGSLTLTHFEVPWQDIHYAMSKSKVFAVVEISVTVFSRMTFHDWKVHSTAIREVFLADEELRHIMVDTVPTHVKLVGLLRLHFSVDPKTTFSIATKKVERLLPLEHDDVRTDGSPGSSDVVSFTKQISEPTLFDLWDETEAEEMDERATVEWLVQERYMTPGAQTLADPWKALLFGDFLV